MAADLHIHVFDPKDKPTARAVKLFQKTEFWGSAWDEKSQKRVDTRGYNLFRVNNRWQRFPNDDAEIQGMKEVILPEYDENLVWATPNVWIGEVSWLKAALFADGETFVPEAVQIVNDLCWGFPVVTTAFINKVVKAFDAPNNTARPKGVMNGAGYSLACQPEVREFLENHRGKHAFCVSW